MSLRMAGGGESVSGLETLLTMYSRLRYNRFMCALFTVYVHIQDTLYDTCIHM